MPVPIKRNLAMITVLAVTLLVATSHNAARSESESTRQEGAQPLCRPKSEKPVQVVEIIDTTTLRLGDGRTVKLIELETAAPHELHSNKLTRYLEELTLGKTILLIAGRPKSDRYGRLRAQLFLQKNAGHVWVQAEIVARGLGLVAPEAGATSPALAECTKKLIQVEKQARRDGEGFWGDRIFQVRNAWSSRDLAKYIQTFQIAEGRIRRLSIHRGRLYINFGRNWKSDLTIVINKTMMKLMQLRPDNFEKLKDKTIRVRGWIEDNNGPLIRVRNPHQLEILDRP